MESSNEGTDEDNTGSFGIRDRIKKHKKIIRSLASPKRKSDSRWAIIVVAVALLASFCLSFVSNRALSGVSIAGALVILLIFILLGIVFDIVGTAVTAANSTPFHSMAARKVPGAKYALKIIAQAGKVSNFCNDVIGDITGIISGGAVVVIVGYFAASFSWEKNSVLINLVLTSIVAALTIGGKALGKNIALGYSNTIIYYVGLVLESILGVAAPKKLNRQGDKKKSGRIRAAKKDT
ncbi:MAG: Mg2+ and Co2+ transporter CorB [Clostridia bacterium]|nr:Mg2+ and Co2+ transporter CorB [Clostridia bacterium]